MTEHAAVAQTAWWRQFSLKSLMIAITVICVLCALIIVPPVLALAGCVVHVGLTGALAITVWRGRGWIQSFAVGALLPHLAGYLLAMACNDPLELTAAIGVALLISCLAGTAAAALHGALAQRNGMLPVPNLPGIRRWFSNEPINKSRDG